MKKIFLILLALVPFCFYGQSIYDVYNISASYYQGSAKSMAMGNAMGAVGQDFSSISINPAGLGLFRKPTFTFTPSINTTFTKTRLNESVGTDSKAKLSVNNFGFVGVNKSGSNVITWAFGMNRTNNFNNRILVEGYNDNNSLIDAYFAEIIANDIYDEKDLEHYSPTYIYPLWQTYLINFEEFEHESREYFWLQEETLYTTGWGFNGKIGIIGYPCKWLRLGAAFHTPTIYSLTDRWRTETLSYLDFGTYEWSEPTSYFSYNLTTPWRANASAAFIFGNFGMITTDIEFVDYGSMKITDYEYDYSEYNQFMSETFKPTMNLRLGTEWRHRNLCFRGGYSFYGSPYGIAETDYMRNAVSCGFGYTKHFMTVDFAYAYTLQKNSYYLYSQYTNYYNATPESLVKENTNIHSLVVTLRFKLY